MAKLSKNQKVFGGALVLLMVVAALWYAGVFSTTGSGGTGWTNGYPNLGAGSTATICGVNIVDVQHVPTLPIQSGGGPQYVKQPLDYRINILNPSGGLVASGVFREGSGNFVTQDQTGNKLSTGFYPSNFLGNPQNNCFQYTVPTGAASGIYTTTEKATVSGFDVTNAPPKPGTSEFSFWVPAANPGTVCTTIGAQQCQGSNGANNIVATCNNAGQWDKQFCASGEQCTNIGTYTQQLACSAGCSLNAIQCTGDTTFQYCVQAQGGGQATFWRSQSTTGGMVCRNNILQSPCTDNNGNTYYIDPNTQRCTVYQSNTQVICRTGEPKPTASDCPAASLCWNGQWYHTATPSECPPNTVNNGQGSNSSGGTNTNCPAMTLPPGELDNQAGLYATNSGVSQPAGQTLFLQQWKTEANFCLQDTADFVVTKNAGCYVCNYAAGVTRAAYGGSGSSGNGNNGGSNGNTNSNNGNQTAPTTEVCWDNVARPIGTCPPVPSGSSALACADGTLIGKCTKATSTVDSQRCVDDLSTVPPQIKQVADTACTYSGGQSDFQKWLSQGNNAAYLVVGIALLAGGAYLFTRPVKGKKR